MPRCARAYSACIGTGEWLIGLSSLVSFRQLAATGIATLAQDSASRLAFRLEVQRGLLGTYVCDDVWSVRHDATLTVYILYKLCNRVAAKGLVTSIWGFTRLNV